MVYNGLRPGGLQTSRPLGLPSVESMYAAWPMDEGQGSTVEDVVGDADGEISRNIGWVSGQDYRGGFALDSNGSAYEDSVYLCGGVSTYESVMGNGFTIAFTHKQSVDKSTIMSKPDGTSMRIYTHEKQDPDNDLGKLKIRNGRVTRVSNENINDGTLRRIVLSGPDRDPNNMLFYYDGVEVGSRITRDDGFNRNETDMNTYTFAGNDNSYGSENIIDNVVFYNRQLTDSEIQAEANAFGF